MTLNVVFGASGTAVSPGSFSISSNDTARLDAQVVAAQQFFERGDVVRAREAYLHVLKVRPFEWHLHWAIGICEMRMGHLDAAEGPLRRAVELAPKSATAQAWLGEWFLRKGMIAQALQATAAAIELEPENVSFMESRAWVLEAAGEMDAAWAATRWLAQRGHRTPSFARLHGRLAPRYAEESGALKLVMDILAGGVSAEDANLYFTAVDLLERAGRYEEAFACAQRGNALRPHRKYDPADIDRTCDRLIASFTSERLGRAAQHGARSERPVFVVGMPRSGTSLVEQILASHPAVFGAGEVNYAYQMLESALSMAKATAEQYPSCLESLTPQQFEQLGTGYLWALVNNAPADAVRVTDKMPLNFMHLGLIQLALPRARVIYCRRDPMDTCVSCYTTDFNVGNAFKYNLRDVAHFYRMHERLMDHWKRVLNISLLEVQYEELVADPEAQSRRMIEFLGLPWDTRCSQFYDTKRTVATASVQQVRRPMYKSSIARWKRYEPYLTELYEALCGQPTLTKARPIAE